MSDSEISFSCIGVFEPPAGLPKQRVVNADGKVSVDGYFVQDTVQGQMLLNLAIDDDLRNGFIPGCPDCADNPPRCEAHRHAVVDSIEGADLGLDSSLDDDKSGCPDRPSPVGLLAHEYLTPDSLQCVHCLGMRREPAPRVEAPSEKPIYDGYWIIEWDDRGKVYRGVVRVETNWAKQRMVYMPNIWHANEAPFEQFAKDFRFINHVTLWSKAEKWAGRNLTPPPAPSLRNALGISCPVCHAPVDVECVRTAWEAKDGQYVPKLIERDPHSKREMAFKKYRMGSSDGKE